MCCLFVSVTNFFRYLFGFCDYIEVPLAAGLGGGVLGQFVYMQQDIMAFKN